MNLGLFALKGLRRFRTVGVRQALREGLSFLTSERMRDAFDIRHDTDTSGSQPLWRLTISSRNARYGVKYQPTSEVELLRVMNHLGIDPRNFTFIDLGCGKGRTLIVASHWGFKRVVGIEFADELAKTAKSNIEKLGITNAEVLQGDAADFRFPSCEMVVYLFNPFSHEVMRDVLAHLKECTSRTIYVVYKVPSCAELFDTSGFLVLLDSPTETTSIRIWRRVLTSDN